MPLKIVMIGSGNVATHLSLALKNAGYIISQVYSRNIKNAKVLAEKCDTEAIDNSSKIDNNSDLYILAVSDKAIANLISEIDFTDKNVVHTAGSVPLNIFSENIKQFGVF